MFKSVYTCTAFLWEKFLLVSVFTVLLKSVYFGMGIKDYTIHK